MRQSLHLRRARTLLAPFFVLLALEPSPIRAESGSGVIRVDVAGLRNDRGQVLCDLFSSAEAFPAHPERANAHVVATITQRKAVCEFHDVSPGRYAITVVHDENMNGKLDRVLGIPSEGVGTSLDARGHFGPPKFEDAVFTFSGGEMNLTVTIAYLL